MGDAQAPVVLVTGAARRIGAVIARRFHAGGYRVIIHCNHSLDEAEQLAAAMNRDRADSALVLQADLNRPDAVQALIERVPQCFGRVDVLVNNASRFYATPVGEAGAAEWDDLIDSNVRAAWFLTQGLVPWLQQTEGAIINISDACVGRGIGRFAVYAMAKAALESMTRSLARELAPSVRVNTVAPGAILWPEQIADPQTHAAEQQSILDGIPAGRLGNPEEIAETTFFLATRDHYMTGATIKVDGGRSLS